MAVSLDSEGHGHEDGTVNGNGDIWYYGRWFPAYESPYAGWNNGTGSLGPRYQENGIPVGHDQHYYLKLSGGKSWGNPSGPAPYTRFKLVHGAGGGSFLVPIDGNGEQIPYTPDPSLWNVTSDKHSFPGITYGNKSGKTYASPFVNRDGSPHVPVGYSDTDTVDFSTVTQVLGTSIDVRDAQGDTNSHNQTESDKQKAKLQLQTGNDKPDDPAKVLGATHGEGNTAADGPASGLGGGIHHNVLHADNDQGADTGDSSSNHNYPDDTQGHISAGKKKAHTYWITFMPKGMSLETLKNKMEAAGGTMELRTAQTVPPQDFVLVKFTGPANGAQAFEQNLTHLQASWVKLGDENKIRIPLTDMGADPEGTKTFWVTVWPDGYSTDALKNKVSSLGGTMQIVPSQTSPSQNFVIIKYSGADPGGFSQKLQDANIVAKLMPKEDEVTFANSPKEIPVAGTGGTSGTGGSDGGNNQDTHGRPKKHRKKDKLTDDEPQQDGVGGAGDIGETDGWTNGTGLNDGSSQSSGKARLPYDYKSDPDGSKTVALFYDENGMLRNPTEWQQYDPIDRGYNTKSAKKAGIPIPDNSVWSYSDTPYRLPKDIPNRIPGSPDATAEDDSDDVHEITHLDGTKEVIGTKATNSTIGDLLNKKGKKTFKLDDQNPFAGFNQSGDSNHP